MQLLGYIHNLHHGESVQGWASCKLQSCCTIVDNLVEAHCYGIGRTGQLLSKHIAVGTDRNVRRFNREGLRQLQCWIVTDEDLRSWNVLHFYLFLLLCVCSAIAQSYCCRCQSRTKEWLQRKCMFRSEFFWKAALPCATTNLLQGQYDQQWPPHVSCLWHSEQWPLSAPTRALLVYLYTLWPKLEEATQRDSISLKAYINFSCHIVHLRVKLYALSVHVGASSYSDCCQCGSMARACTLSAPTWLCIASELQQLCTYTQMCADAIGRT